MKNVVLALCVGAFLVTAPTPAVAEPSFGHLVGVVPSVTVEPYYEAGELDVNILPVFYQKPLGTRVDVRLLPIVNLGVRSDGNALSHLGAEAAFPFFFKAKSQLVLPSQGVYLAPVIAATRNKLDEHRNVSLALEPGFLWLLGTRVALSLGVQVGATYFNYDDGGTDWGSHFAVRVGVGRWL